MPFARHGARRRSQQEAVLGVPSTWRTAPADASHTPLSPVTGIILDASPHLLVLHTADGEVRLPMTEATAVWHGGRSGPAALRPGRDVIVRPAADGLRADRIWVDIGRVTGIILACGRDTVEVDMGTHRGRAHVVIPPHALGRILVRHPRLEPGYLIDVICVRSADGPHAVRPGTSQPGYRADDLASPESGAPVPDPIQGTATWFGGAIDQQRGSVPSRNTDTARPCKVAHATNRSGYGAGDRGCKDRGRCGGSDTECLPGWRGSLGDAYERLGGSGVPIGGTVGDVYTLSGAAYPAVDSEGNAGGCIDGPSGCVALPYLSLGSGLSIRNECTGRTAAVPVIECGCTAALYCDRCVECGTSPRGRVVELAPAAFVSLGGDLDAGCFNAVVHPMIPSKRG